MDSKDKASEMINAMDISDEFSAQPQWRDSAFRDLLERHRDGWSDPFIEALLSCTVITDGAGNEYG